MKIIKFIWVIFKRFPLLVTINVLILLIMSLFGACSLLSISPLIDFLIHPDMQGASPITLKAVSILNFFGLPVTLTGWLIILVVFVALNSAFNLLSRYCILKTKFAVTWSIMHETFKDFFDAQWQFFASSKQGELLNTFSREIIRVGDAFNSMTLFFANLLQIIFFLILPFYLSWKVTGISLIGAVVFAIPFILLGGYSYRLGTMATDASNDMVSVFQENFSLSKIVLGFAKQRRAMVNLKTAFDSLAHVSVKAQTLTLAVPMLYRPFSILVIAIALYFSRLFGISLSTTVVLLLSLQQIGVFMGILTSQRNAIKNFFPSYEQIQRLRERAMSFKQISGSKRFTGFTKDIAIKNATFSYPEHEPVLIDINARIRKGNMVAFVGESGAGKSTLIDILMGFYRPANGSILIDDILLEKYDINSYREKIGYVPQDSVLFNISIKDNLLWASEYATDKEIIAACSQANADDFISKLPEGYNTIVGNRGVRLSGGQVQRVALARAILRKPELLILDEATSSLDTFSEKMIQQAIENIAKETTVVVIAHRLSTIMKADYIYVLKEGRIIEEGTHKDLLKIKGHFNQMTEVQFIERA